MECNDVMILFGYKVKKKSIPLNEIMVLNLQFY